MCGSEMVNGRNINTPDRRFAGALEAKKLIVVGCILVPLFVSTSAFAQQSQKQQNPEQQHQEIHNHEQPLAATSNPLMSHLETLPVDISPETLNKPSLRTINPNDIARQDGDSERWKTQTFTQPTGLSSAGLNGGVNRRGSNSPNVGAKRIPTDLITTDLLLAGSAPVVPAAVPLGMASRSDGVINLSSTLRGALFASPGFDNVNTSVFKLDLGGQPCLGTAGECRENVTRRIDIGYSKNITKGKMDGFNLQLTPHGGLRVDEDGQSALVGALVRIGDNLREGADKKSNTWYFFAGADAEAVTYAPNSVRRLTSGDFALQDQIVIGDAQAGLGYRIGDADVALTYYKRQAKAENYSYDEDAAALSITWKR